MCLGVAPLSKWMTTPCTVPCHRNSIPMKVCTMYVRKHSRSHSHSRTRQKHIERVNLWTPDSQSTHVYICKDTVTFMLDVLWTIPAPDCEHVINDRMFSIRSCAIHVARNHIPIPPVTVRNISQRTSPFFKVWLYILEQNVISTFCLR